LHIAELIGDTNVVRDQGLGDLSVFRDEIILNILGCLPAISLKQASFASKAIYCFANHDELWKALVLKELSESWDFRGSWQNTYLASKVPGFTLEPPPYPKVIPHFYSDLLHQSWLCATLEIDPSWLETETIDRRSGLTVEEFRDQYERPNRPVILTDLVASWPASKKWNRQYLQQALHGCSVMVGDAPLSFDAYCRYVDAQCDEMPLYLFDKNFARSAPQLAKEYSVPPYFADDLFSVLGDESRPDYRWLIIGPYKSGSTFHQDPNATSAWNAVIRGSKKWVMYPPSVIPPGVYPSSDGADVASPVSIMEWMLSFYSLRDAAGVAPMECTVREGEILFVPRGWWHMAINLEETVAITQNYVSCSNLRHVLAFLRSSNASELVSGVRTEEEKITLHKRFVEALEVSLCGCGWVGVREGQRESEYICLLVHRGL